MRVIALLLVSVAGVAAFAPATRLVAPAVRGASSLGRRTETVRFMAEEESSELVPVNPDTIKTSTAVVAGIAGFVLGGPVFAGIFAAGANYVATKENEFGEVATGVGQVSLQLYNFVLKLNGKYDLTGKASDAAGSAFSELKSKDENDVLEKVEGALKTVSTSLGDLNSEYDLGDKAKDLLKKADSASVAAIDKGIEFSKEKELGSKVKDLAGKAVDKVKESTESS